MKEVAGTRLSGMTVRGWLNVVLLVVGVVVFGGALLGAVLLNRTDEMNRQLVDELQPIRVAAYQLQAALRDQETAVRGYVIAADPQFLTPYYDGQRTEQTAAQSIRDHAKGRSQILDDLDAIEKATDAWRTQYADPPMIAGVAPGSPPSVVTKSTADAGKAQFDTLRSLFFDTQNQHLSTARNDALHQLDTVKSWRDRVLAAMIAAFLITGLAIAILIRNAVTRPLEALAAACRRITIGNFAEQIVPEGPRDIRSIATDVEDMRRRIVDELEPPARLANNWMNKPPNCAGPTPSWNSSPTSPPTICRSRCAKWHRSANCWRSGTVISSTNAASSTSISPSTRQADAGSDQRPADVLPGRPAQLHPGQGEPRYGAGCGDFQRGHGHRGDRRRDHPLRPAPHSHGRPDAADDAVAEPGE